MLIGLGEDKNPNEFGFTRSRVTKVSFVIIIKNVSAQYLKKYLLHTFYISYAD